jgi:hypothetical protein
MNKWECTHHGCPHTAVGRGGAAGLIAVGWYFKPGVLGGRDSVLLCPAHHPSGPCQVGDLVCNLCAGDASARSIQTLINRLAGFDNVYDFTDLGPHER